MLFGRKWSISKTVVELSGTKQQTYVFENINLFDKKDKSMDNIWSCSKVLLLLLLSSAVSHREILQVLSSCSSQFTTTTRGLYHRAGCGLEFSYNAGSLLTRVDLHGNLCWKPNLLRSKLGNEWKTSVTGSSTMQQRQQVFLKWITYPSFNILWRPTTLPATLVTQRTEL